MAGMTDRTWVGKLMDFTLHNIAAPIAPTSPLHLRLYTVAGSETASGTEASGNGYTANGNSMGTASFGANSSGVSSNANAVQWTASGGNLGGGALVAVEVWDTAGTPVRLLWGTITSVTVATGNTLNFAVGSITADASQW